jgi:hypothetical protein
MTTNIGTASTDQVLSFLRQAGPPLPGPDTVDFLDPTPAYRLVEADVIEGLAEAFQPEDPGLQPTFDIEPMRGENSTAVAWTYTCRHSGPLGRIDSGDFELVAIPATNKRVVIEGVTILRENDGRIEFRRYIDWNTVLADLGVVSSFRAGAPPSDEDG